MQTTYDQYSPVAFAGLLDGSHHVVRSYAAEATVSVGRAVRLGTNPEKQVSHATTGANAIGFALHDHARESNASGVTQYNATEAVSVLTRGRMWVSVADAVVAGAAANLITATGLLTDNAVAAGIEAFTQISVRFVTSTTGAGLAIVEVK